MRAAAAALVSATVLVLAAGRSPATGDRRVDELPDGFIVGAGTSAYQCEGAWNTSGKGEGIFDKAFHSGAVPATMDNADVAADSYNRFREDVAAARALKLQMYRFSLSWSRLLPTGYSNIINPDGVRYYNQLLNELNSSGIQPMVTLFHFDYPFALESEFGGWNDDKMIDAFVDFADVAFSLFGEKVRWWTTLNEPFMFCSFLNVVKDFELFTAFVNGSRAAPAGGDTEDYGCIHRMVLAHGRIYRLYQQKYAAQQKGKIGLTNISFAPRPNSTSYDDVAAARRYNQFTLGTTFGPVVSGRYPAEVRRGVDEASRREGLPRSRLPDFSQQQSDMIRGTIDFLGVNLYFGQTVAAAPRPEKGSLQSDASVKVVGVDLTDPYHKQVRAFEDFTPWSLREAVLWLWDEYHLPIFVTENGCVMEATERPLQDHKRAVYHSTYMRELLRAVHDDGVHVLGYVAWSLIDVFEWISLYKYTFGLVHVDYATGSLNRTLKESSAFFVQLAETRSVPLVLPGSSAASLSANTFVHTALVGGLALLCSVLLSVCLSSDL